MPEPVNLAVTGHQLHRHTFTRRPLDADIKGFFDTIGHEWLMKFLQRRMADPRMLRLIRKWLRAWVSEDGTWARTEVGTPQG